MWLEKEKTNLLRFNSKDEDNMPTPSINIAVAALHNEDFDFVAEILGRMTRKQRVLKSRKRKARDEKLGKPWSEADLKERARFKSKFEYNPRRRKYMRRDKPLNYAEVYKVMKKQSRLLKRRAERMGKKAARVKRTYVPLNAAVKDHIGMFVDISESEDPEGVIAELLNKATKRSLGKSSLTYLTKYYSRPMSIEAFRQGSEPLVLIREDEGLYTFESSKLLIKNIKIKLTSILRSEGSGFSTEIIQFDNKHTSQMESVFNEIMPSLSMVTSASDKDATKFIKTIKDSVAFLEANKSILVPKRQRKLAEYRQWANSFDGDITKESQKGYKARITGILKGFKTISKRSTKKADLKKLDKYLQVLENEKMFKAFEKYIGEAVKSVRKEKTPKKPKVSKTPIVPKPKKPKAKPIGTLSLKSLRNTALTEIDINNFLDGIANSPLPVFTEDAFMTSLSITREQASKILKELKKLQKITPFNNTEWAVGPPGSVILPKKPIKEKEVKKVKTPDEAKKLSNSLWDKMLTEYKYKLPGGEAKNPYISSTYRKKIGPFYLDKIIQSRGLSETDIKSKILLKLSPEDLNGMAKSARVFLASTHRTRNAHWYFYGKMLSKIVEDVLSEKRQKEAVKGPKKKGQFYEDPNAYSTDRAKHGTVLINDTKDGEYKEYKAALIPMSAGRRGIALQDKRFDIGDVTTTKDRYGYGKNVTINGYKVERKPGYTLHRYNFGDRGWFRDFFEEGTAWKVKVG